MQLTEDITRDRRTSAGEQTAVKQRVVSDDATRCHRTQNSLVANVPARVLAATCRPKLSLNLLFVKGILRDKRKPLKTSYLGNKFMSYGLTTLPG